MRRFNGAWAAAILLAGCATTLTTFPDVKVAIPSAGGAQWDMQLQEQSGWARHVTLFINGTEVGAADIGQVVTLTGNYQGHPIQAQCSQRPVSEDDPRGSGSCVVYVDGTQVATLLL